MPTKPLSVPPSPATKGMPSATKWWLTHGPFDDPEKNALDHLQRYNFEVDHGVIYPPPGFELSREDKLAISFLVDEYDYAYRPATQ